LNEREICLTLRKRACAQSVEADGEGGPHERPARQPRVHDWNELA
jgi:hypothetical protein